MYGQLIGCPVVKNQGEGTTLPLTILISQSSVFGYTIYTILATVNTGAIGPKANSVSTDAVKLPLPAAMDNVAGRDAVQSPNIKSPDRQMYLANRCTRIDTDGEKKSPTRGAEMWKRIMFSNFACLAAW
jgi:hypothetical protein